MSGSTAPAVARLTGARIAGELRDEILRGDRAPGSRILQEDLADAHGASRLPVREALRLLEAEGLLTLVANTGAWVSRLSAPECEELYRIRERIEPLLLHYAIPAIDDATIDRLELLADAMERTDDVGQFIRLDREFHLSCYAQVSTTMLGDLVVRLWNRTQHARRAYIRLFHDGADRSAHHEHRLMVDALRRRDAPEAERVLASHIRRTRLELMQHPDLFDT
jgi:DNA-binding GntR family transcriptional regulator